MLHQNAPILNEWKVDNLQPFDELIISWNADFPNEGQFLFYVKVKINAWSPWLLYASWGSKERSTFQSTSKEVPMRVFQDIVEVLEGEKATGFQIKIETEGLCIINTIRSLHVYTNSNQSIELQNNDYRLDSISLKVPGLSQMALNHTRNTELCSPTSTTAVTQYLLDDYTIDPLHFAQHAWDSGFNIFGNWIFNIAQASICLGHEWNCWVERLNGFQEIYNYINEKIPVVVSVRGPLPGSAQPYSNGHLIVVIGYDSLNQKVLCMDPAFPSDNETHVAYNLSDFVQAWNRRGNVAYIFKKNQK